MRVHILQIGFPLLSQKEDEGFVWQSAKGWARILVSDLNSFEKVFTMQFSKGPGDRKQGIKSRGLPI